MLTIRRAQRRVFDDRAARPYVERVLRSLKAVHVVLHEQVGDEGFRAAIHRGIELGREHDIGWEDQVSDLIELVLLFGGSFERSPGAAYAMEVLRHPRLQPFLKTGMIRRRLLHGTGGRLAVKARLSVGDKRQ